MSPTFKDFFVRAFPELASEASDEQLTQAEAVAQQLTQKSDTSDILDSLMRNAGLMGLFSMRMKRMLFPRCPTCGTRRRFIDRRFSSTEIKAGFATVGLLGCLFAVIFLRKSLPNDAVNVFSMIAGVFSACLKDVYSDYRRPQQRSSTKSCGLSYEDDEFYPDCD
ncbi:hypothetical protein [Candidatus Hydrogenosomobacter endosymbioticus]|nr:hypothetical protein [Candidatus Hydrogenosomobacter endosymbioticus]